MMCRFPTRTVSQTPAHTSTIERYSPEEFDSLLRNPPSLVDLTTVARPYKPPALF
jgi:hypothetical protein